MWIVFVGAPGAGKGTQCERLSEYLTIPHLSTGEMLREARERGTATGKLAGQYIDAGDLVPDDVILRLVEERLAEPDCTNGALLDGFPRTLVQAEAFDRLLESRGTPLGVVLALEVPEEMLVDRLLARGRRDDTRDTIVQRFRQYAGLTSPLIDYYRHGGLLQIIDGTGEVDEVFNRVKSTIDRIQEVNVPSGKQ